LALPIGPRLQCALRNLPNDNNRLLNAEVHDIVQFKGHRAVGGMRASIYNAMPIEGVKRLVEYMREFEAKRG